ncbi:hypothetical protein NDU88_002541 [Pleurodeles waltl]|uniref:Uncharacterized protein n=1 Tax=Pleurodeles waltl TaxID=8319 RepID=A0AAV7SCR4_PLEWA|nr:hypothetical protein NDU88_002541 [Pleurodeles waltl]
MRGTLAVGRCQLLPISAPVPMFGLPVRPHPGSQIQAPATAKAQSSIQWGTHPLSSPLSVLMGVHLIVFVIFSPESVVPQDVRRLRGLPTPDSRPGAVRYAHLSPDATLVDPCSATGPPQMTHSARQPIPMPLPCPGTPIGPSTMPSGRLWQRWGPCARSIASVEGLHQGGVPPGPPVPSNCVRGPRVRDLDSRCNCEHSRTWSARLVPAAVGRSPPGRGFQRGEGPPASPRNSKFSLRCERRWSRVTRLAPPAADREASGRGFQQGRGRMPLSATGQTAPPASRPRTALGA